MLFSLISVLLTTFLCVSALYTSISTNEFYLNLDIFTPVSIALALFLIIEALIECFTKLRFNNKIDDAYQKYNREHALDLSFDFVFPRNFESSNFIGSKIMLYTPAAIIVFVIANLGFIFEIEFLCGLSMLLFGLFGLISAVFTILNIVYLFKYPLEAKREIDRLKDIASGSFGISAEDFLASPDYNKMREALAEIRSYDAINWSSDNDFYDWLGDFIKGKITLEKFEKHCENFLIDEDD